MVDLAPGKPGVIEVIVWVWSLTLAIEMIREVKKPSIFVVLFVV
jgi:hypothetical protein